MVTFPLVYVHDSSRFDGGHTPLSTTVIMYSDHALCFVEIGDLSDPRSNAQMGREDLPPKIIKFQRGFIVILWVTLSLYGYSELIFHSGVWPAWAMPDPRQ